MLGGLCQSMSVVAMELKERGKAIEAERRGAKARLLRHYDAIEVGDVTEQDVGQRIRELKARIEELDAKLIDVHAKPAGVAQVAVDTKQEADGVLTPPAPVPSSVMSRLRQRDSNSRLGG